MSIYPRAAAKCVTGLCVILCKHFTVLLYHATAGVGTGKQFGSSLTSSKPQTSDRPFKTKASRLRFGRWSIRATLRKERLFIVTKIK